MNKEITELISKLGLVNYREVEDANRIEQKLNDVNLISRAKSAQIFFDVYFKQIIKQLIHSQMVKTIAKSDDLTALQFQRGVIVGLSAVREWFEDQILVAEGEKQIEKFESDGSLDTVGKI